MRGSRIALTVACLMLLAAAGCSRQQSDWEKARATNNLESYEQFIKKYPAGEFTGQAQARVKELEEERDWQKARDTDTPDAYQAFLKQYPEGKWAEESRIRIENFSLAQAPVGASAASDASASMSEPKPNADSAGGAPSAGTSAPPVVPKPKVKPVVNVAKPSVKPATAARSVAKSAPVEAKGGYAVQLGAFSAGAAAAEHDWTQLLRQHAKTLGGVKHRVLEGKTSKGHLYRLQAIGLTKSKAQAICASIKSKTQGCIVVPGG